MGLQLTNTIFEGMDEIIHPLNQFTITTKNIQNTSVIKNLQSLLYNTDVILIQETTKKNLKIIQQMKSIRVVYQSVQARAAIAFRIPESGAFQIIEELQITKQLIPPFCFRVSDALIWFPREKQYLLIISVYAPAGDFQGQKELFEELRFVIEEYKCIHSDKRLKMVMGGDFNNVFDTKIDSELQTPLSNPELEATRELLYIIKGNKLVDTFRHLAPRRQHFTNHHNANSRRLDRIYISGNMKSSFYQYQQHKQDNVLSTHDTVSVFMVLSNHPKLLWGKSVLLLRIDYLRMNHLWRALYCFLQII